MTYKLCMRERISSDSAGLRGGYDGSCVPSSDHGLCVTVISTTPEGTTAALNAAKWLGEGLDAQITLLEHEIVRFNLPLEQPPLVLDCATEQQRLLAPGSCAQDDVNIRVCLCRDSEEDLPRVLSRRALVLIGGRRHWWVGKEERLERALRRLGHHVIFVDVAREAGRNSGRAMPPTFESDFRRVRKQAGVA